MSLVLAPVAWAKGTWVKQPDLSHVQVSWQTDDGKPTYAIVVKFTQAVQSAKTSDGTCTPYGNDPAQVQCPTYGPTQTGEASGQVDATLTADAGCGDSFGLSLVTPASRLLTAQQDIISANDCTPPPSPSPTPDTAPAGEPVARPKLPLVVGDGGGDSRVRVFPLPTLTPLADFNAYGFAFTGGVRVASGDVNGDGVDDVITAPGPGGAPNVKVFDGKIGAVLRSFFAFDPSFAGGVFVAAGDVNGDGKTDVVVGAGDGGAPHVAVFSGADGSLLRSFLAFDPSFTGGVRVAAGDVNGDGGPEIIAGAGPGGGPVVRVFDGATSAQTASFFAFAPSFTGGVHVAAGDVNGDGRADVVVGAGGGSPPQVKVYSGASTSLLHSFFAYDVSFTGGVRVAAGDVNGDGFADIVTGAGAGGAPNVRAFNGATGAQVTSFFAFDPSLRTGVYVGMGSFGGIAFPAASSLPALTLAGLRIRIGCPVISAGGCTGRITLLASSLRVVKTAAAKRPVVLGRGAFATKAGSSATVHVRLTRRGRRAIRGHRRLRVVIQVRARDGAGNASTRSLAAGLRVRRR